MKKDMGRKLREAVENRNLDKIREIIKENPQSVNIKSEEGLIGVFYAARSGNININRFFAEKTMTSYNIWDSRRRTPLYYAVESGNTEVCRYYVERIGYSPLDCDKDGVTAMEYAYERGQEAVLKYFEEVCGFRYEEGYKNPVRRGFYPDPSVVRVGEDFYMVNSSFFYFPCIPVSHSKDLINWKIIGHAIVKPEWARLEGLDGGRGYWAPDISYYKGRFYICATYRNNDDRYPVRMQMVTSSEKPEGPYDEPFFIEADGIDPSIFNDDDGRRYMLLNRGASIFELSSDGKKKISETRLLYYGNNKRAPEGPHIIKKDGYYYLFQAEGGTGVGHMITLSRSRELFGKYEPCPYNPIMTYREEKNPYIHRCGHGKPFMTKDGRWYIVYLCGRFLDGKYTVLGRETCLDELEWTSDGWCVINKGRGASALAKKPFSEINNYGNRNYKKIVKGFGDNGVISDEWYTLRGRNLSKLRLEEKNKLFITGDSKNPTEKDCDSILLRRQESFDFMTEADVRLTGESEAEAGLIGYYDENSFYTFSIVKKTDGNYIEIREKIGGIYGISFSKRLSGNKFRLRNEVKGLKRIFSVDGKNVYTIENASYLSDEGVSEGKRFTGAMTGVYCCGKEAEGCFEEYVYETY